MPPCYTFDKLCIPDSGMDLCQGAGVPGGCAVTVTWFWLLAAAVGAGLLIAGGKR